MAKKKRVKSKKIVPRASASKSAKSVMAAVPVSNPLDITITFTRGVGQATVTLFRDGSQIGQDTLPTSGTAKLPDTQTGDSISVNGTCTGRVKIEINVTTDPITPESFGAGSFNRGYDVI